MKSILAITHAAQEGLGTIAHFLRNEEIPVDILYTHAGDKVPLSIEKYSGLIVMGGGMNVDETDKFPFLKQECLLIQNAIASKRPVLGICLGAQLIAKSLGAKVYQGNVKEVGWLPIHLTDDGRRDPAISAFSDALANTVFHWHGDTFPLPEKATLLASSDLYPTQAFSYGNLIYGLQFHFEITQDMVNKWVIADKEWLKNAPLQNPANTIIESTKTYLPQLERSAHIFCRKFFNHVGLLKNKIAQI